MNNEFIDRLVTQLPDFEPARPLDETALRYAGYYGIDFTPVASQHLGLVRIDGFDLAMQVWKPSKPRGSLLILHGYYDHMGLYKHLIRWALRHDLAVLALDLPGHGLSSGERASIDCFLPAGPGCSAGTGGAVATAGALALAWTDYRWGDPD